MGEAITLADFFLQRVPPPRYDFFDFGRPFQHVVQQLPPVTSSTVRHCIYVDPYILLSAAGSNIKGLMRDFNVPEGDELVTVSGITNRANLMRFNDGASLFSPTLYDYNSAVINRITNDLAASYGRQSKRYVLSYPIGVLSDASHLGLTLSGVITSTEPYAAYIMGNYPALQFFEPAFDHMNTIAHAQNIGPSRVIGFEDSGLPLDAVVRSVT